MPTSGNLTFQLTLPSGNAIGVVLVVTVSDMMAMTPAYAFTRPLPETKATQVKIHQALITCKIESIA